MAHELENKIDSLEHKIHTLIRRQELLVKENNHLQASLQRLKTIAEGQQGELMQWEEKFASLKVANAMLGSNEHKRETKLKIDALVKNIDQCIAQLSER